MNYTVLTICTTLLLVLVVYWIMPIEKMNAVNKAMKSLLQIFPITKIVNALINKK